MPNATARMDQQPATHDLASRILAALRPRVGSARCRVVDQREGYTNDISQVRLDNGRTLVIKRGRYDWSAQRYEASRRASALLRAHAGIEAPAPLDLPDGLDDRPLEVYWRIDLPTLEELWPGLTVPQQREAMRSFGRLIRRMHDVRTPGHGPLPTALLHPVPLTQFLAEDLGGRLYPAVAGSWPEGLDIVDDLLSAIPEVGRRVEETGALLHCDLHTANVLCESDERGVRCIGLIDLEAAQAGPVEMDLARMEITSTSLFGRSTRGPWMEWVMQGYEREVDATALAYFRAYHYLNFGFHAMLMGHEAHAAEVARAARRELASLAPLVDADAR